MKYVLVYVALIAVPAASAESWRLGAIGFDNDGFVSSGSDGHYTAGFTVDWQKQLDERRRVGLRLGYELHTPADISIRHVQPHDQPWAGFFYGRWTRLVEQETLQIRYQFEAGLTGPMVGAEHLQRGVHNWTDSDVPEGWQQQLNNELTINGGLQISRSHPFALQFAVRDYPASLAYFAALEAGTARTQFIAGTTLRVGQVAGFDGVGGLAGAPQRSAGKAGRFVYVSYEHRWVEHDLLIDGSLLHGGPGIDSKRLVRRLVSGIRFSLGARWLFDVSVVKESRRFSGPLSEAHQFGRVELRYR